MTSASGFYAAGILPYTVHEGSVFVLLGKDVRNSLWSDFGGKSEVTDNNKIVATAMREFYEETCGIVLDFKSLRNRMAHVGKCVHSMTQNGRAYYMFPLEMPYVSYYRTTFRKLLGFMKHINMFKRKIEKTDIKWVSMNKLLEDDSSLRPVFKATLRRWWETEGSELVKYATKVSALMTKSDSEEARK